MASDLERSQQLTAKREALQVEKTGKLYSCSRFGIPQYLLLIDVSASLSLLFSTLRASYFYVILGFFSFIRSFVRTVFVSFH